METIYLVHEETGHGMDVPNDPLVLKHYADRGWHPAERPAPVPYWLQSKTTDK